MNEKKGPNGFLIGLLMGGAIGALISTRKGRKILKDVADYGLDYVGNSISADDIEDILNGDEEEMMGGEMENNVDEKKSEVKNDEPSRHKRLFRGIKKK
jgi:uncharacterized protein YcfJ